MPVRIVVLVIGLSSIANAALAQTKPDLDPNKARKQAVFTMAQLIYAASETCKQASPELKHEYQTQLDRLNATHPKLVHAVVGSPFYEKSCNSLDKMMQGLPSNSTRFDSDCKGYAWMLKSSLDHPEGQKTLQGFEDVLTK